jgi:hypothetical protein
MYSKLNKLIFIFLFNLILFQSLYIVFVHANDSFFREEDLHIPGIEILPYDDWSEVGDDYIYSMNLVFRYDGGVINQTYLPKGVGLFIGNAEKLAHGDYDLIIGSHMGIDVEEESDVDEYLDIRVKSLERDIEAFSESINIREVNSPINSRTYQFEAWYFETPYEKWPLGYFVRIIALYKNYIYGCIVAGVEWSDNEALNTVRLVENYAKELIDRKIRYEQMNLIRDASVGVAAAVGGGLTAAAANSILNTLRTRKPPEEDRDEEDSEIDYILQMRVQPKDQLMGDGEDSCRIICEIIGSDGSKPEGSYLFNSSPTDTGVLSARGPEAIFTSYLLMQSTSVTVTCVGTVELKRGITREIENSIIIEIIGAAPTLRISANPEKIVGDGVSSSTITTECKVYNKLVESEVQLQADIEGSLLPSSLISPREVATFTPYYADQDESATIIASTTIQHSKAGSFLAEDSVTIQIKGTEFNIKASPSKIDGDEVSRSFINIHPTERTYLNIGVKAEPQEYGKLVDAKPPTHYIANLTEMDREVTIKANIQVPEPQGRHLEEEARVKIIGAKPEIGLRTIEKSVYGDGESRLRIECETYLFDERVDEKRLQELGAKIEWIEQNLRDLEPKGKFVTEKLTYSDYEPKFTWDDTKTEIKARLTLTSKETGKKIEKESRPIEIWIKGANPELKLEPDKSSTHGVEDKRNKVKIEAKIYLFDEERRIPEDTEVEFELVDTDIGYRESRRPNEIIFSPRFLARDKDRNKSSQYARIKSWADIKASELFPQLQEGRDKIIHFSGECIVEVFGCTIAIIEPQAQVLVKEKEGRLFDVKAHVKTQNGLGVSGVNVKFTFEKVAKEYKIQRLYKHSYTDDNGVAEVVFTYSDLKNLKGGLLKITSEINGARYTRDWDQITIDAGSPAESLSLVLTASPLQIPGAEQTENIPRIWSTIDATITCPSGDFTLSGENKISFTLEDKDLSNWEEHQASSYRFGPAFLTYKRENKKESQKASIKAEADLNIEELHQISPLIRGPTKSIGGQYFDGEFSTGAIVESGADIISKNIHLEESIDVSIIGCRISILEPENGERFMAKEGELFEVKAKVTAPSQALPEDPIPHVPVKFIFKDGTKKPAEIIHRNNEYTDKNGIVKIMFELKDLDNSEYGKVGIKAEISGVRGTKDWDEKEVLVIFPLELDVTARIQRVFQDSEMITSNKEKYEVKKKINLEMEKKEDS